jgi:NADH:ubiquinone oxidoreductase subunit 6 (subunit J)
VFSFTVIALLTLASATIALTRRNLIHSALLLIASWGGIAAFYLWAGAEFVAFAQVLIYVGAISMVVLFAVLLTRHSRDDVDISPDSLGRAVAALVTGGAVLGVLAGAILDTRFNVVPERAPTATVREIGLELMGVHTVALLVIGVLLTVALLGAIVIAATDRPDREDERS